MKLAKQEIAVILNTGETALVMNSPDLSTTTELQVHHTELQKYIRAMADIILAQRLIPKVYYISAIDEVQEVENSIQAHLCKYCKNVYHGSSCTMCTIEGVVN